MPIDMYQYVHGLGFWLDCETCVVKENRTINIGKYMFCQKLIKAVHAYTINSSVNIDVDTRRTLLDWLPS